MLLNVSTLRTGRVTLCRLTYGSGKYSMHIASGTARTPALWEEDGWAPPAPQLPSLEIKLDRKLEDFFQNVMSQHYIICYGDQAAKLRELCGMLGVGEAGK